MTILYDPSHFIKTIIFGMKYSALRRSMTSSIMVVTLIWYIALIAIWRNALPHTGRYLKSSSGLLQTGLTFLGTFATFNISHYNSHCYQRWYSNWTASLKEWSRLNDLGMQVYAHMGYDHRMACDVMRLMHAANCLTVLESVLKLGKDPTLLIVENHKLLSPEEAAFLKKSPVNSGNQCVHWALQLVSEEARQGRIQPPVLAARIDQSICEWRQNATLPPVMFLTPIPYAYFHTMGSLLVIFNLFLGLQLSLAAVPLHPDGAIDDLDIQSWSTNITCATISLLVMTVSLGSLLEAAKMLADSFGHHADDLPAGEYVMRALAGHKALFKEAIAAGQPYIGPHRMKGGHAYHAAEHNESVSDLISGSHPDKAADAKVPLFHAPLPPKTSDFIKRLATHPKYAYKPQPSGQQAYARILSKMETLNGFRFLEAHTHDPNNVQWLEPEKETRWLRKFEPEKETRWLRKFKLVLPKVWMSQGRVRPSPSPVEPST